MAKNYLRQMEEDSRRLRLSLDDQDELPGWVNAYIFTSADRLQQASRYMQGRMAEQGYGDAVETAERLASDPLNWVQLGVVAVGVYLAGTFLRDMQQDIKDYHDRQRKEADRKKRLERLYGKGPDEE